MSSESGLLDRATCTYLVIQHLQGQGWQLADPQILASEIWRELADKEIGGQAAVSQVGTAVWLHYARLLHNSCRDPQSDGYERAWTELRIWLSGQAHRVSNHPADREDLVQDTLAELDVKLGAKPLRAPQTLWSFLLQVLRRKNIDRHRRRTAQKRQDDKIESLEAQSGKDAPWQEWISARANAGNRQIEEAVVERERNQQLKEFFGDHLASSLQRQVADAHFLAGLAPAEIARLMDKKPHEIRMVKARIVKILRSLPPEEARRLQEIMGVEDDSDAR